MDLVDFFEGRYAWPKLYRLLKQLPMGSRYAASLDMDIEAAKARILDEKTDEESLDRLIEEATETVAEETKPRSSAGHTLEVELLMQILDQMGVMNSTAIAMKLPKGKKPPRVIPRPRPRSMYEILKAADEQADVENELFGNLGQSVDPKQMDTLGEGDSTLMM